MGDDALVATREHFEDIVKRYEHVVIPFFKCGQCSKAHALAPGFTMDSADPRLAVQSAVSMVRDLMDGDLDLIGVMIVRPVATVVMSIDGLKELATKTDEEVFRQLSAYDDDGDWDSLKERVNLN